MDALDRLAAKQLDDETIIGRDPFRVKAGPCTLLTWGFSRKQPPSMQFLFSTSRTVSQHLAPLACSLLALSVLCVNAFLPAAEPGKLPHFLKPLLLVCNRHSILLVQ